MFIHLSGPGSMLKQIGKLLDQTGMARGSFFVLCGQVSSFGSW